LLCYLFWMTYAVFYLFKKLLQDIARTLESDGKSLKTFVIDHHYLDPNFICWVRIWGSILWVIVAYYGQWYIAIPMFVAIAMTDYLDGFIARRFGCVSEKGKWLDPFADKVCTLSVFGFFVWQGFLRFDIFCGLFVLQIASQLTRPFLVWLSQRTGTKFETGAKKFGKIKACLEFVTISLILFADRAGIVQIHYVQAGLNLLFGVATLLCCLSVYEKIAPAFSSLQNRYGVCGAFTKIF